MKKAVFVSTLAVASLATAAAFACGGDKGGMRGKIDTNNDGQITLAESQAAAKSKFEKLDTNKNGAITRDEVRGRDRLFDHADTNKDGKVTIAEMQNKAKEHFVARDTNKDNVLTRDEMRGGRGHGKKGPKQS